MPKYTYTCDCGHIREVLRKVQPNSLPCDKCKGIMARKVVAATMNVSETLDNGHMTRAITRPANAEALYKEQADKRGKFEL